MKTIFILSYILFSISLHSQPVTIASWNFENASKRAAITNNASFISNPYTADDGTSANINVAPVRLGGGPTFSGWVAGTGGTGTYAPNSTNWQSGANSKFWLIKINTNGYENLTISSKQRSSDTGPRDFQLEYSTDSISWHVVPNSSITVATNFTSGVLNNLPLPSACNNKNNLYIRWMCISTVAADGGAVASGGTNRIDDILIKGEPISIIDATINPTAAVFNIDDPQPIGVTITWNDANSLVQIVNNNTPPQTLVSSTDYIFSGNQVTILTSYLVNQFTASGQTHTLYFHFDVGNPATLVINSIDNNIISAQVTPDSLSYDLTFPSNLQFNITWNSASAVVSIVDTTSMYVLQTSDYVVSGNQLTFLQTYLSSVFTQPGQERIYRIDFNVGSAAYVKIRSIASPQPPVVLAYWNFENSTKRAVITDNITFQNNPYTADDGIASNKDISPIRLGGGSVFSSWATWTGMGYAPNANTWQSGAQTKYWVIKLSTQGYGDLKISSKQRSSSTGPKNFRLEYSLDSIVWMPVAGGIITVGDNFTDGVLDELPLPIECENQLQLYLRWIMTDNIAVNGSSVVANGTNRIDNITVKGTFITNQAEILSYYIPNQIYSIILPVEEKVLVEMPYGTDLTQLVASFTLSPNAIAKVNNVIQVSGVTVNNFTDTVFYDVIAGDGITTKKWAVIVKEAAPSSEAEILSYTFVNAITTQQIINSSNATVDIYIKGYNYNNLIASFLLSSGATASVNGVTQISGQTPNNFNQPVIYVVTAEDGITQKNWTVRVYTDQTGICSYNNNEFNIFPNPTKDLLNVIANFSAKLNIFDLNGKIVKNYDISNGLNIIKIEDIKPGNYLLKIQNTKQIFIQQLIITN